MDTSGKLRHLSLCTGYGGIDIGLKRALEDISAVAYVEIEAFAVENLVAKIESNLLDVAPIWTDLKTLAWSSFRGCVDIVSGGFPCQPFSLAGKKDADTDARHLWPYIVKGLAELGRPPLVFLENVEGIISSRLKSDGWSDPESTPVLLHVLRELERMDYHATAGIFSAAEVGAPHQRKRVFILARRADLNESGCDIVSEMLRDSKQRSMDYPAGRYVESAGGRRRPNEQTVFDEVGESSAVYPAPRGAEQYASDADSEDASRSDESVEHTTDSRLQRCRSQQGKTRVLAKSAESSAYPAPRGSKQRPFEPPRVTTEIKSEMGRVVDGAAGRLGYAELCRSMDNRVSELRLLGNGVVPATAERAFRVLWARLEESHF